MSAEERSRMQFAAIAMAIAAIIGIGTWIRHRLIRRDADIQNGIFK